MGAETIFYGIIEGAVGMPGEEYRVLQELNDSVLKGLPDRDEWPFLTRHMFASSAPWPHGGLYQTQVIHFGASLKEDVDLRHIPQWQLKFERLLERLFWFGARLHVDTEYAGTFTANWTPTQASLDAFYLSPPQPVAAWSLTSNFPSTEDVPPE